MSEPNESIQPAESPSAEQMVFAPEQLTLAITLELGLGAFRFDWFRAGGEPVARGGILARESAGLFSYHILDWVFECNRQAESDGCTAWPSSVNALLRRIQKRMPVTRDAVKLGLLADKDIGMARAGRLLPMALPPGLDPWRWLGREILEFARVLQSPLIKPGPARERGQRAMHLLACALLKVAPAPSAAGVTERNENGELLLTLHVTFDQVRQLTEFVWTDPLDGNIAGRGIVRCAAPGQLHWDLEIGGRREPAVASQHRGAIRREFSRWLERFPTRLDTFAGFWVQTGPNGKPLTNREPPFGADESPWDWIEDNIAGMAEALRPQFPQLSGVVEDLGSPVFADYERYERRMLRKEQRRAEEELRRQEILARKAAERERREAERRAASRATAEKQGKRLPVIPAGKERPPLPAIPLHLEMAPLCFQETAFPISDLRDYALRERAALWWISNQSDDLLCLPYCRIEHLDYQVRAALRVLGPLRGRALLSDEVGLGKTIEAGLIIKELLTRGMVKRFLVLTVPSLVDQWQEELQDKFGLDTVTTNEARADVQGFWQSSGGVVASLHTLKQPARLSLAQQVHWDILIVDEAHYLRNRDSQAWQAVNALPRQFLLLLTATPVQNSLEELYNLVTLLQPGQLPSPKEFRARFFDPKRPRQPRQPEELRRLLGQVMIRNTRANAAVQLPPRRAETVSFHPGAAEQEFWQSWETEFRQNLQQLKPGLASLWGRLVLQAAGSSPAAWRGALAKFPEVQAARRWCEQAPLADSWNRKCQLIPPLTRLEGGAVVFTQFLETQSALARFLTEAKVPAFVINGSTPAVDRQPITEEFRRTGGALLLTHSGTEGRNLQFCHRLINFDLPWNPMEIEQRIGRLHRLGQEHPVRIYNFVQTGTLQEHLLQILQEKLNLFELVVGETGLVLGEEFSSEEFAGEILRRWRDSEGRVAEAFATLGDQLAAARAGYDEVKKLDETLFAKDYESL